MSGGQRIDSRYSTFTLTKLSSDIKNSATFKVPPSDLEVILSVQN